MWADQNTHLDEAESYIKKALAADPENGAYLDSLGWVDYRRGKYEQALAELLSAVQALKGEDPTVYSHIGDTYEKLNQIPQALEYWQKSLALDQSDKKLAEKIARFKSKVSKGEPAGATPMPVKKYPTHWQRKTMWASLTADLRCRPLRDCGIGRLAGRKCGRVSSADPDPGRDRAPSLPISSIRS